MFLKDVWPHARIGLYCELYHRASYPHTGFDPEFDQTARDKDTLRLRLRNLNNALHFDIAEVGLSPTHFQADTFPDIFRDKITVLHYGIDTDLVCPNENAVLKINDSLSMSRQDEVITFINRNLEPYRGYHIFMRALPRLLRVRPKAQVVLMGGDDVSYGARPPEGKTWKQIFIDEVRDQIGADHLEYLDHDRMVEAGRAGNPEIGEFCSGCFTGCYPTEDATEHLEALAAERAAART